MPFHLAKHSLGSGKGTNVFGVFRFNFFFYSKLFCKFSFYFCIKSFANFNELVHAAAAADDCYDKFDKRNSKLEKTTVRARTNEVAFAKNKNNLAAARAELILTENVFMSLWILCKFLAITN